MTCDPQQCPKCGYESGDTWAQCGGSCPMPMSPHYVADDMIALRAIELYLEGYGE